MIVWCETRFEFHISVTAAVTLPHSVLSATTKFYSVPLFSRFVVLVIVSLSKDYYYSFH